MVARTKSGSGDQLTSAMEQQPPAEMQQQPQQQPPAEMQQQPQQQPPAEMQQQQKPSASDPLHVGEQSLHLQQEHVQKRPRTRSRPAIPNTFPDHSTSDGSERMSPPQGSGASGSGTSSPPSGVHGSGKQESVRKSAPTSLQGSWQGSRDDNQAWANSFQTSAVRVDIADLDGMSTNATTSCLNRCKKIVLKPYWRLLTLICWRAFGKDRFSRGPWIKSWNVVYPILVLLMLLYTYLYNVLACQGNLNKEDRKIEHYVVTIVPATPVVTVNASHNITPWDILYPAGQLEPEVTNVTKYLPPQCAHITTTYIIPSFLHFIAFLVGVFYFRVQDNEHLYALMEKVFLMSNPLQGGKSASNQTKLMRILRMFLVLGGGWIVWTVVTSLLFVMAFGVTHLETSLFGFENNMASYAMYGVQLIGVLLYNFINVAAVINYVTQCELVIFYMGGITTRLREKSVELKTAMQDMIHVRQCISRMNGPTAKMTALCIINFTEMTVIGFILLMTNQQRDEPWVWLYRTSFAFQMCIILIFPLIQAARVGKKGTKFQELSFEMRVFGYMNCSMLDLDSFLAFVSTMQYRAKLFSIPIRISYLVAVIVTIFFLLLILLQTGAIESLVTIDFL